MWRGFESELVSGFLSFNEKRWNRGYKAFSFWELHQFFSSSRNLYFLVIFFFRRIIITIILKKKTRLDCWA